MSFVPIISVISKLCQQIKNYPEAEYIYREGILMKKIMIYILSFLLWFGSSGMSTVHAEMSYDHQTVFSMTDLTVHEEVVTATAPKLTGIYNSAKGADIRWLPQIGVTRYYLMRKYNGVWQNVRTLSVSSLTMEGSSYRYIDAEIAGNYGMGYIYSIAVMNGGKLVYDTRGLPLYRLKQPTIKTISSSTKGSVTLTWTQENCHGYEIQYSADNGNSWIRYPQIINGTTVTATINGLNPGSKYAFRIRSQKNNKDRGTTWSQYSAWRSITVSSTQKNSTATVLNDNSTVYYVSSGSVYHIYSSCSSLSRSKNVKTMTLKEAKAKGRRLCKICENMNH